MINDNEFMLYFIKSLNYLKVGYSKNKKSLVLRIKNYRTHNPCFTLLEVVNEGSLKDERNLHRIIKNYQYYGEWFYDNSYVHKVWNNYTKDMNKVDIEKLFYYNSNKKYVKTTKELNNLIEKIKQLGENPTLKLINSLIL